MSKVTLEELGLGADDLAAIGKLSESGMTPDEIADAVKKIHTVGSSASEIDGSVSNKTSILLGNNMENDNNEASWTNVMQLSGWNPHQNGSNTPVFDNINTNNYIKFSDTALRIGNTTNGASATHAKTKILSRTYDMSDTDIISIWVYVDGKLVVDGKNSSSYGQILLVLGDSTMAKSSGANIFGVAGGGWHRGWNNVTVHKSSFMKIGTSDVDWSTIGGIQIRITPSIDSEATLFYIDSIFLGGRKPKVTPVVISLDDSTEQSYTMNKIMNAHGIPVSNFIMPEEVSNHNTYGGTLTLKQCKKLYADGNHIGFHNSLVGGYSINPSLMVSNRDWLLNNGFTREDGHNYGSYPNGVFSQAGIDYAKANGIRAMRSLASVGRDDALANSECSTSLIKRESVSNGGIADPFRINATQLRSLLDLQTGIEDAILHGSALLTYNHAFSEVGGVTVWEAMAKYLKTKVDSGVIECLTFPQFVKKYSYQ